MATRTYNLQDLLKNVDDASAWSQGKFSCISCRRRYSADKFDTSFGSLCVACVQKGFKQKLRDEELLSWPISRFVDALGEHGPMRDRLAVLWKFRDVLRYTEHKGPSKKPELLTGLVNNLGYVQPHPLAQAVRQAAYHACVTVGKPLIPLLLEMCRPTPWQFYANIVMTLGSIDAENPDVRTLVYKAARDTNPEIRNRAQAALQESQGQPVNKQGVFDALMKQIEPSLRQFIQVGMAPQLPDKKTRRADQKTSPKKGKRDYLPAQKRIEDVLIAKYSVDALRKTYRRYLNDLFSAEEFPEGNLPLNKLKKKDVAWAVSRVYTDKALLKQFLALLPEEVKSVLHKLVWEDEECDTEMLEKTFQVEVVKEIDGYRYGSAAQDIHDEYSLFLVRREYRYNYGYRRSENPYQYHLSLPDLLRTVLKKTLPPPPEYDLIPVGSPKKTAFLYEDSDRILQQLPLFYSYIDQGNLKLSKNGSKVLKSSMKQMTKYCRIREFYENGDKDLVCLKTQLLIDFCRNVKIEAPVESSPECLRQLFQTFFNPTGYGIYQLSGLLYHLQGVHHADSYNTQSEHVVRTSLQTLLQSLPVRTWFDVESLVQYCVYRDISLEIIDKSSASRYLFFRQPDSKQRGYYYDNKSYVSRSRYKEVLLFPFLKAVMFLFATFGLVDIAYDLPKNQRVQKVNASYLSVFDGLRYIRLTPLGAYVLGVTDSYHVSIEEETANVMLDEKRLLITLDGRDRLKMLVLEKMAEKIGETFFKVSYQSFLKECTSQEEIHKKIDLFHTHIAANPPPNWQEFLDDVLAKINPFSPKQTMAVYKLKPNQELIGLIARDDVLKKYILKTEAYHIVIESKHLPKVKKRLEEFGYFIDNF